MAKDQIQTLIALHEANKHLQHDTDQQYNER
jgi:hypothetical protein